MNAPRWTVLLPVALLMTLLAPALRALPGGMLFPDPWLLLLLFALPDPEPHSSRRSWRMVAVLGLLRAAVSAVSLWSCWAGLGLALALRREAHRRLVDLRFLARFLVGTAAGLPQAFLDAQAAQHLGLELSGTVLAVRAAAGGLLWAAATRPARWRTAEDL